MAKQAPVLFFVVLISSFTIISTSCKKDESPTSNAANAAVNCDTIAIADATGGGCNIRLVTPGKCNEVDVSGGKVYEIAWTSDGTFCETPWTVAVYGNPPSQANSRGVQLSENVSAGITHYGGIINVSAADFTGLTSYNGVYHWIVASYYGSHPTSIAFKLKK